MSLLDQHTERDIASIAKSLRGIEATLEKAFPPADTRPLVDRLAEVTESVFASFDERTQRKIEQNSEF